MTHPRHYQHLSLLLLHERQQIFHWRHEQDKSVREIARLLQRSASTVSREIRRHLCHSYLTCHYPHPAQHECIMTLRKRGQRPRLKGPKTKIYVEGKLKIGWSPEIIAGRLKATKEAPYACHEAIYQHIYKGKRDLIAFLPRKHVKRRSKSPKRKTTKEETRAKTPITERPTWINDRSQPGHWESDSITDRLYSMSINVLIERKTRLVHITESESSTSGDTSKAIIARLKAHPETFVRSITYDNGSENAKHEQVNATLACTSYFCAPYHSWEKGAAENANEKIRRCIPKKSDLSLVCESTLQRIEDQLNARPRKCFHFRTPLEVYRQLSSENTSKTPTVALSP